MEVKVPSVGESVTEVTIAQWLTGVGTWVEVDQPLVSVESDKADMEIPSPIAGTIREVLKSEGEDADVGEIIAIIEPGEKPAGQSKAGATTSKPISAKETAESSNGHVMPAAARVLGENGIAASEIAGSGPGGRVLKEDAKAAVKSETKSAKQDPAPKGGSPAPAPVAVSGGSRDTETVRMSRLRQTIATRLVEAQNNAAILTTFNEVDMSAVMAMRKEFQEEFISAHGIKLGFMSFFVKASIEALKRFPGVNARIDGKDVIYHHYYDIGVAIGGGKGLVVPVIRNAERLSMAGVEQSIAEYAKRAKDGSIRLDELQGGTFSISNGGVYGSMLSTPILNPPQSGILGLHNIQKRAVVVNDAVVVRPMMYIALSYDHRIVDGREAVGFLKHVKECIETPSRMLVEV